MTSGIPRENRNGNTADPTVIREYPDVGEYVNRIQVNRVMPKQIYKTKNQGEKPQTIRSTSPP